MAEIEEIFDIVTGVCLSRYINDEDLNKDEGCYKNDHLPQVKPVNEELLPKTEALVPETSLLRINENESLKSEVQENSVEKEFCEPVGAENDTKIDTESVGDITKKMSEKGYWTIDSFDLEDEALRSRKIIPDKVYEPDPKLGGKR